MWVCRVTTTPASICPPRRLTIEQAVDDIAAVLDDAQVSKAVVYGTSYGTYLAAGLGVRHPDRVHAMVLDSPLLSADDIDWFDRLPAACCGTVTTPRRPNWPPRCASSSTKACSPRLPPSSPSACTGSSVRTSCAVSWTCLLSGRDWLWGAIGQTARMLLRARDALPPRAGSGRADRLPRAQLRRGARRPAARSGRDVARNGHRGRRIRGRALRPRRRDAEVRVADRRHLRWARPHHAARGGAAHRGADPAFRAGRTADRWATASSTPGSGRRSRSSRRSMPARSTNCPVGQRNSIPRRRSCSIRLLSMAIGVAAVAESAVPSVVPRLVRRVAH